MMEIEDDAKEPGTIVQEIQSGFMMKDRLLRPAPWLRCQKKNQINQKKADEMVENDEKKRQKNEEK